MPGFDEGPRFGILTPAGTSKDVVTKLNAGMTKIIQSPDFRKRMEEIGAEPEGDTAEQMAVRIRGDTARIRGDTARYAKLFKEVKVAID